MIIIRGMYLVLGITLGFLIAMGIWGPNSSDERECLVGQATYFDTDIVIYFGEAMVCGEVVISDIRWPTIDGPVQFYHNHE